MSRKQRKRSQRRSRGGDQNEEEVPAINANATVAAEGGKRRKTRKVSKGASDWNKKVMMVYHEMKKKNPAVKLGAAMKECSRRKKRGEL